MSPLVDPYVDLSLAQQCSQAAETIDPAIVLENFKDSKKAELGAVHTLVPVVDMVNHESNHKLRCSLTMQPSGAIVVTAGA